MKKMSVLVTICSTKYYSLLTNKEGKVNRKICVIAVVILLLGSSLVQSQEATDRGAKLVSGALSFSSQGGDLHEGFDGDRLTTIAVVPSVFYFIAPGIGLGGDLSYTRLSQGDNSFTTWGAGPKVGYFIDSGGNTIPFVAGGVNFLSTDLFGDSETGFGFKVGGGILIRKGHLAVAIEAAYLYERFKPEGFSESITGNTIAIGVGFAGFFFN